MPAILKSEISTMNAAMFVNNMMNDESNIYLAVASDASYPWENEDVPPAPLDNLQDEATFRSRIIGIKRCTISNCMLMVPRVNWQVGMSFNPLSETSPTPRRALDYYCVTSDNFVYQCVGKDNPEALTMEGGEPDLKVSDQKTIDGYTWKFLYDITAQMINAGMFLDSWMPVPYNKHGVYPGGTITEDQNSYGDPNANWTLGAFRILITVELEDEGDVIPYDTEFRQVGLLYDPQDNGGSFIAGESYKASDFDTNSGHLFYLENRRVIKRATGQTELLQVLLCM